MLTQERLTHVLGASALCWAWPSALGTQGAWGRGGLPELSLGRDREDNEVTARDQTVRTGVGATASETSQRQVTGAWPVCGSLPLSKCPPLVFRAPGRTVLSGDPHSPPFCLGTKHHLYLPQPGPEVKAARLLRAAPSPAASEGARPCTRAVAESGRGPRVPIPPAGARPQGARVLRERGSSL